MMAIIVALVLALLALAFVLYPLYRPHKNLAALTQTDTGSTVPAERELAARTALQEVELDYQLGNIAEGDYTTLRERYMRKALVALKARYDREQELDTLIEEQLRKMKENDETNTI